MNDEIRYKIAEKLKNDKEQTTLTENGYKINNNVFCQKQIKINFDEKVICPFCLIRNNFSNFKKEGNLYNCPNCKNRITIKTLYNIRNMEVKEFAFWVYEYRLNGFFKKIDFKQWTQQLYLMGISKQFWEHYKSFKGINIINKTIRNVK